MEPLISVIVPIYNVEKFLPKCIESVLRQTYQNLEILLVDDGAKDSSGAICDKYAQTDSRITVIHKENSGVSDTRNIAVGKAKGDYFCFIDGDDNITEDYIETMYRLASTENADFTMCSYIYKWADGKEKRTRNTEFSDETIFRDTGVDALRKMLYGKIYAPTSTCKLFRKNKSNIVFPRYTTGEDVLAAVDYFKNAAHVAMINKPCYNYMQNENSVMHTFNPEKIFDTVLTADEIYKKCENLSPAIKKAAAYYLIEKNLIVLMKLYGHKECRDKLDMIKVNIKTHRKTVLLDQNAEMRTRIACLISYLGVNTLCKIRNAMSKEG